MADLQALASQVRRDIVRMVHAVSSGHPGGSLGCADLLSFLYNERLTYDAKNFTMDGLNEDVFFLSIFQTLADL
jgi:transketolase